MWFLWLALVWVHGIGCIAVLLCGLAMPVWCVANFGWWSTLLWFPLGTLLTQMATSVEIKCVVTDFENALRKRIGKPPIDGYVTHYFVDPIFRRR